MSQSFNNTTTSTQTGFTGSNPCTERVTLRIPKTQLETVEKQVEDGEFPNRSEAIRHAISEIFGGDATDA